MHIALRVLDSDPEPKFCVSRKLEEKSKVSIEFSISKFDEFNLASLESEGGISEFGDFFNSSTKILIIVLSVKVIDLFTYTTLSDTAS